MTHTRHIRNLTGVSPYSSYSAEFPGDIKPARDGVYLRKYPSGIWAYCKFEHGLWFAGHPAINTAFYTVAHSVHQNFPWKGLSYDPSTPPPKKLKPAKLSSSEGG